MPSFDRPKMTPQAPSSWIERFQPLIRAGGTVLDLACGSGRHTRFMLNLGYQVVAADVDTSGLADLSDNPGVNIVEADLETGDWPFAKRQFDGIIITNYVHRPHFPHLCAGLKPNGILLIETFGAGNGAYGRPRNPDFLLQPGELLSAVDGSLMVLSYEHGVEDQPRPAVRQRICAQAGTTPQRLGPEGEE